MSNVTNRVLVEVRHQAGAAWWLLEQQRAQRARCEPQREPPRGPERQYRFPLCPSSRVDGFPLSNRSASWPWATPLAWLWRNTMVAGVLVGWVDALPKARRLTVRLKRFQAKWEPVRRSRKRAKLGGDAAMLA